MIQERLNEVEETKERVEKQFQKDLAERYFIFVGLLYILSLLLLFLLCIVSLCCKLLIPKRKQKK